MSSRISYLTLGLGVLSPLLAPPLGYYVFRALSRASTDPDSDFVFRFVVTGVAMATPFFLTLVAFIWERRDGAISWPSKTGLFVATLYLGLLWVPITRGISRAQQLEHLSMSGEPAPAMQTSDLDGNVHRLSDHAGRVVLVNIWATWCGPCRREMPELDRLYKERQDDGLMVFGISSEELGVQKEFAEQIQVSYPLLTVSDGVPEIFSTSARYPANFLIDRRGLLQAAPSADQPFEELVAVVDRLLAEPAPGAEAGPAAEEKSGALDEPTTEAGTSPTG